MVYSGEEMFLWAQKDTERRKKNTAGGQWESEKRHNPFRSLWKVGWALDVDVRAERTG
jgi:hypothetical protein